MRIFGIIGWLLIFAVGVVFSQPSKTTISYIAIDDKTFEKDYKVILMEGELKIEVPVTENAFEIPACIDKSKEIGVRLLLNDHDLYFGSLDIDHFGQSWSISVDRYPFSTEGITKEESRKLRLVYVLTFASGGQKVYKIAR